VFLGGQPIKYNVDSTNQSWILHFTYTHRVHNIVVNFNADEMSEFSARAILLMLIMVVISVSLLFYFRKGNRSQDA
jgi:hypothetical protein